ncbi:hypothetical protein AALP_AA5G271800 [Arabis alpina]|uniref:CCHC-type domain-containing protein n=1 Tax=Arabis alpina TaxID=50452 RepID=A0A087GZN4_ARAAL|nr:hypothetical protein AALP_AA5G271800 [Arabis alpina]
MPPKNKAVADSTSEWAELRHTLVAMQETIQHTIQASIQELGESLVQHLGHLNQVREQEDDGENDNPFARNEQNSELMHQIRRHQGQERRDNNSNRWELGFEVEIPEFQGGVRGDSLVDWIVAVEEVLEFKEVPDDRRVPLVATRFRGHAASWWLQLKTSRSRTGKAPIRSWEKLKKHLRQTFLPHNYDRTMYTRLQNLKQGSRSVDDYAEEFYVLLTRNDINDSLIQLVSRFIGGLRPQLQNALSQFDPTTLAEAHRRAVAFEQQARTPSWNQFGSKPRSIEPNGSPSLPHSREMTDSSHPAARTTQPSDDQSSRRPPPRTSALRCFNCGEPGHRQTACPQ